MNATSNIDPFTLVTQKIDGFSPEVLWLVFGVIIAAFTVISIILLYHWVSYTHKREQLIFLSSIYFGGAIVIIGIMAASLSLYINSL